MRTVRRIPFVLGRDCEILKTNGTVGKLGSSATRCIERNLKSRALFFCRRPARARNRRGSLALRSPDPRVRSTQAIARWMRLDKGYPPVSDSQRDSQKWSNGARQTGRKRGPTVADTLRALQVERGAADVRVRRALSPATRRYSRCRRAWRNKPKRVRGRVGVGPDVRTTGTGRLCLRAAGRARRRR